MLVVRAVGTEVLGDGGPGGLLVLLHREGVVAKPLVEGYPAVGVFKRKGVRWDRPGRSGVGPAQQPVLAVGQDAHAHAALFFQLRQVVVELLDVLGVGVEAAGGADPAFELDERVEGGEVHGAARTLGGRVFLDYLLVFHEAGDGQEIADRAGDVGLGLALVVAPQDFGCGLLVPGIVRIDMHRHSVIYPGLADGWGLMESAANNIG